VDNIASSCNLSFFKGLRKRIDVHNDNNDNASRLTQTKTDSAAIFLLSSAYITLDSKLGLKSTGRCAICVKSVNTPDFNEMKQYVQDFLNSANSNKTDFEISFHTVVDSYGYLWVILNGKAIEDIVAAINAVGDTINEKGFSNQLLAAMFEFTNGYNTQYLIYNYKLDKFYPFVPTGGVARGGGGQQTRNNEEEMKIMAAIANEIPFEKDLSFWYPIWNLPF
jgi:PspAB-like protein